MGYYVSIHAPLARSNDMETYLFADNKVSIHAPLARSNTILASRTSSHRVSIHAPLARSNSRGRKLCKSCRVSIHAPLARSNQISSGDLSIRLSFNTCSSCEEQLVIIFIPPYVSRVSIHAPLARSNFLDQLLLNYSKKFQYMLLLRGATLEWIRSP